MDNFTKTYLNTICEATAIQTPSITEQVQECIKIFSERINNGFGWIAQSDVMRQFYDMFPDFEKPIFEKSNLESFIIDELKEYTDVRDE